MGVEGRNTIRFKVNLWKVNGLLNSGCAGDESWVQTSFEEGASGLTIGQGEGDSGARLFFLGFEVLGKGSGHVIK